MKKFLFIATFLASWLSFAPTYADNVAKIGSTEYATLQAAFNAAEAGQTVELLGDYNASSEAMAGGTRQFVIKKSITFDGCGYTLTTKQRGIGVGNVNGDVSSNIDVTIKNVTINNTSEDARCIDTRGKIGSLTLDGVTLSTDGAPSGYTQPLTIGNSQTDAATVTITNSTIQTNNDGTAYYAIITFNPVNMTITNSTLKGWACIYAKGAVSSAGSAGSIFNIDNSTIISKNIFSGTSNAFAAFVIEDNNVTINVTNSDIQINSTGDQWQTIVLDKDTYTEGSVNLGEGNTITLSGKSAFAYEGSSLTVSGGSSNVPVPEEFCAEGYIPTDLGNGTYGVKVGSYVAQIGNTKYETLAAAVAAAQSGDVIELLADVIDAGNISLKAGVTLDGKDKTISGNSAVYINVAGGTVQNVNFKNIHNSTNKLSAIYVTGAFAGEATITDCSFDNCDWDAIQVTPVAGANIVITNNIFSDDTEDGIKQQRYIHVQSAQNVDFSATVTGNVMLGKLGQEPIGVYYPTDKSKVDLTKNYIESINDVCILVADNSGYAGELVFPAYTTAAKEELYSPVASIQNGAYAANFYAKLQDALDAAEAADPANIVIDLLADATLDITARANVLSIGTENTQSITINGNNHTLTFNQKNSDWNDVSTANDAVTRLILNDMNITNSGYNSGHWKRTNLFFNCIVEMNNVTSTALGFKNDATLNNVTIVDNRKDIYGIWIMTNGNNVTINGLNLNTTGDGGRGIAIKDEDSQKIDGTSLEITNATFATEKKGAILVTSPYTVDITASNLDISNVAVDNENAVWVDKKHADKYSYVTLTSSDETMAPEDGESAYVASLVRGEQTRGYYATFAAAYASADYAEGDTYKLHKNTTESVEVAKVLTIVKNGCTAANITAAEGFKKNETEEQITFVTFNPVCEIAGGEQYETLEAAFAAAQDGETITLLADCAGNGIVVPQGKFTTGLTVDFGGFTYTVDGETVGSTGTQTQAFQLLKDNKITFQNGTIYSEKAKILVQNYSNLTLEGMTLTMNNENYTSAYTLSNNNGNVVIDGTTINANPAGGFAFDVCRYASYPSVSVTVQGESVINGNIELSATGNSAGDGFSLTLTEGTLNGNISMATGANLATVTKADAFEVAAPEGYKWVSDGDGTSSLAPCVYVAQIGSAKYETLEAAFAAAQDGATITLLADCAGNGIVVPQGKFTTGLTVNFGGFTYTVDGATVGSTGTQTQAFQLLKDNKITFQNGTIYSEKAKILVQNYSNLTLEGMTLTLNNSNYTSAYTLSNNNGSVVIDGSTINANPAGGFAFDVCRYASYLSVSVTVQGESVINGNIEISASGNDAKDGFGLTLTAGTFNGNIVLDASAAAAMEATPEKVSITKADAFEVAAPEGYKWVSDGDGTSSLAPCVYVAQIGDVKYETFAEAAEEANGEVITLLANIEDAYTIAVDEILMVKLNGHTLTVNAPAGYTVSSTVADDVTTYSVPMTERDIVLTDGQPYTFNADTQVNSVTYKRKLSDKYTGYYISWYVPFDYTITAEDAENFTFYKISMIANAPEPGEVEESDKIWLYLTRMKAGDILYANRPYVFKAPNAGTTVTYSFTTENATLHARATGSRMNTATAAYNFDFYGTYESTLLEKNLFTYYTNSNGKVSATGDTSITLSSYRWYIKATAKNNDNYNYAPVFVFTEDDDATGIKLDGNAQAEESYYNLNGMRINKPANGVYIIKYSDGSVKKVAVK